MPWIKEQPTDYAEVLAKLSREFRARAGSSPAAAQFADYADALDSMAFDLLLTEADTPNA